MSASRWFDRWQWSKPEEPCHCGHLLREHPADRFRSCSRCVWCDDFRQPPHGARAPQVPHAEKQESPNPSGLGL